MHHPKRDHQYFYSGCFILVQLWMNTDSSVLFSSAQTAQLLRGDKMPTRIFL